jgi:hypothetical protein
MFDRDNIKIRSMSWMKTIDRRLIALIPVGERALETRHKFWPIKGDQQF